MKRAVLTLAIGALALLALVPPASADLVFGAPGSGAGEYLNPQGVAVDTSTAAPESGRVYVADTGNDQIDVFSQAGTFLFSFGSSGSGAGQLRSPQVIAVDPASHAIYVGDQNHRVQKFDSAGNFLWMVGKGVNSGTSGNPNLCTNAGAPTDVCGVGSTGGEAGSFDQIAGIAVRSDGLVLVAGFEEVSPGVCPSGDPSGSEFPKRIQTFDPAGELVKAVLIPDLPCGRIIDLALDSGNNFYLATSGETGAVRKYDEAGALVTGWGEGGLVNPSFNIQAIAVDPAGQLFVSDFTNLELKIRRYDPSGTQNLVFFGEGTLKARPIALAFHTTPSGDLYAIEEGDTGRVVQLALPDPGPLFVPGTTEATGITGVKATLQTTFNPEGKPSTARFQYLDKASFEAEGEEFKGPSLQVTPESDPSAGGFDNQTVSSTNVCVVPDEATCLKPDTTYVFRAIAKNADGEVFGDKAEFTTNSPHEVKRVWATDVGTDTARLHAEVNPLGIAATAHFEYVSQASFEAEGFTGAASTTSFDLGAGSAPLTRAAQLQGLEPATAYRYRLVVEDAYFPPTLSEVRAFATFAPPAPGEASCANQVFRTGPSAALPDCRAYEMVTPLDKDNGDILTRINITGYPTNFDKASLDGSAFAYTSYRAFADPKAAPYTNQYLAKRGPDGWSSENLTPARTNHYRDELENEFQAFSPDLTRSWMLQEGDPTLDACAAAGVAGLYRREGSPAAYEALSCSAVGKVAKDAFGDKLAQNYMPEFQGASADGTKALIRIDDQLLPEASKALGGQGGTERPIYQTYLSVGAGVLRLVSTLPDGSANPTDSSAGTALTDAIPNHNRHNRVATAISTDGTRVYWTAGTGGGTLYLRLNADQEQSKVKDGACTQAFRACTIPVSETVTSSRAIFQAASPTGTEALFKVTQGPLAGNLYRFDSQAEPPASELLASGLADGGSILGASEDLSRVYYASTAADAQAQSEGAIPGEPNVYLSEGGASHFIATLSSGTNSDLNNFYGSPISNELIRHLARSTPDGSAVVFMSNSAELAEQAAGYDNTDLGSGQPAYEVYRYEAASGELACVSCNPTGAPPEAEVIGEASEGNLDTIGAAAIPAFQNQLHQGRYLSDDGSRVYFESFEALALADTNGAADVYQWQAAGTGGCTSASPGFAPSSDGCLRLISSGRSPDASHFLDAGPNGEDVFFTTSESLAGQDYGLIDVYDARVGGGYPPPSAPPASCEGEACQGPLQAPDDRSPASSTYQGAGNVVEETPKPKACPKGKVRRKGRCVKKNKHRHHQKQNHRNGRKHR